MVDFRYHLVSIIAVFLALAVGIVVGTAALNGPIVDSLRSNINRLSDDKRDLEQDVQQLQGEVGAADDFADTVGPDLLAGALADERVLLVTTDGVPDGLVEQLRPVLESAGASVTGRLDVGTALADPENRALVDDLVAEVVPAGVDLPDGEPVERAAAELAAALTTGPDAEEVDAGEAQAVVSAFQEADLLAFEGETDTLTTATLVVVIGGPAPDGEEGLTVEQQQQLETVLVLAQAFDDRSRGVVVTGPAGSADEGGLVAALRGQSTTAADVSSVDNVDRGLGRVAVVRALDEQGEGRAGQYGSGGGATGPLPEAP